MVPLDFLFMRKKSTANIAKKRLQIIVAERRRSISSKPHYLPQLRKDILEVICKYVQIDQETVNLQLEQKDTNISILELNVTLSESKNSRS